MGGVGFARVLLGERVYKTHNYYFCLKGLLGPIIDLIDIFGFVKLLMSCVIFICVSIKIPIPIIRTSI